MGALQTRSTWQLSTLQRSNFLKARQKQQTAPPDPHGHTAKKTIHAQSVSAHAADIQYPSQKPLSLTEGVPPNLLVTLDDSGSMYWGYAPILQLFKAPQVKRTLSGIV